MHPIIPILALAASGFILTEASRQARWHRRLRHQYALVAEALGFDDYPPMVVVRNLGGAQYVVWMESGTAYHRVEVDAVWLERRVAGLHLQGQLSVVSYVLGHELAHVGHRLGADLPWWERQEQERHADRVGGDVVERLGLPLEPARRFASTIGSCSTCTHADGHTRFCDVTHGYHRGA